SFFRMGLSMKPATALCLLCVIAVAAPASGDEAAVKAQVPQLKQKIDAEYDYLEGLYKHLHAHPEVSLKEEHTSARLAKELRELGFEVSEKIGGYGVVGVLKNGAGPTVLVRTDMDALPVLERTGVPYTSKVHMQDKDGKEVPAM